MPRTIGAAGGSVTSCDRSHTGLVQPAEDASPEVAAAAKNRRAAGSSAVCSAKSASVSG